MIGGIVSYINLVFAFIKDVNLLSDLKNTLCLITFSGLWITKQWHALLIPALVSDRFILLFVYSFVLQVQVSLACRLPYELHCTWHSSPSVLLSRFQSDYYFVVLKHLQESMNESEVLVRVPGPSDWIEQGASWVRIPCISFRSICLWSTCSYQSMGGPLNLKVFLYKGK